MNNKNKDEGSLVTKESDEIKNNTTSDTNAQLTCEAIHEQEGARVTLYHASTEEYDLGDVISGEDRQVPENKAWIEDVFEQYRPNGLVSRRCALFAGRNGADCVKYLKTQRDYDGTPIHLYRVEMEASGPHPMALIGAVEKRGHEHPDVLNIVKEYWQPTPTHQWCVYEYLGQNMKVVKKLRIPTNSEKLRMMLLKAGVRYRKDYDSAETL